MVGGSDEAFERAQPILEPMAKAVIHAGGPGAGQAAKICNNMILGATMIATCEAFVLAQKLGLDPQVFFDIASKASGQSWSMTTYTPVPGVGPETPADHDYEGGFAAALMLKDLKLAMDAAQARRRLHADGRAKPRNCIQRFVDLRRRLEGLFRHHQDDRRQLESAQNRNRRSHAHCRVDCPSQCFARGVRAGCNSVEQFRVERRGQFRRSGRARPNPRRRPPATKEEALKIMHERHEGMEKIGKATKTIKRTLESPSPDLADDPEGRGDDRRPCRQVADLVPARHRTRRRQDPRQARDLAEADPDFAAKDRDFRKAAQAFNATAASGNLDAIKAGFADLGKTCKACHDKYRTGNASLSRAGGMKLPIWDLPTRLFHWLLVGLIALQLVGGRRSLRRPPHLVGRRGPERC